MTGHIHRRAALLGAATFAVATRPAKAADITLRFLFAQQANAFDAVIAEFERRNPGIKVQKQQVPFNDLNAQVQSRLGAKDTGIDVYGADEPRIPAFARRGFLLDVSAARNEIERATDAKPLAAVTSEGKVWGFPLWTSTNVLYYNKDHLTKAGIPFPSADPAARMTWEQLNDAARKAQAAGAKIGFSVDQIDRYYQLQPFFESSGAGSGLTGDAMLTPAIATPKWVETAAWYGRLYADGIAPRGVPLEQIPGMFAQGQIAFFMGGPWQLNIIAKAEGLNFGIAPVPYFAGGRPVTPTDSWAMGISPYSENKEAALKFARFLTLDNDGALLSTAALPVPPANKAAFVEYLKKYSAIGGAATAPLADLVRYELANTAVSRPRSIGWVPFEEIMNRTFSDIRNGADAGQALTTAEAALKTALSRIR